LRNESIRCSRVVGVHVVEDIRRLREFKRVAGGWFLLLVFVRVEMYRVSGTRETLRHSHFGAESCIVRFLFVL
jgi:hypothetical protein